MSHQHRIRSLPPSLKKLLHEAPISQPRLSPFNSVQWSPSKQYLNDRSLLEEAECQLHLRNANTELSKIYKPRRRSKPHGESFLTQDNISNPRFKAKSVDVLDLSLTEDWFDPEQESASSALHKYPNLVKFIEAKRIAIQKAELNSNRTPNNQAIIKFKTPIERETFVNGFLSKGEPTSDTPRYKCPTFSTASSVDAEKVLFRLSRLTRNNRALFMRGKIA